MMKEKKFRRRADDDDDGDAEDSVKTVVKSVAEKSGKDRGKDKPGLKTSVLLSFAEDEEDVDGKTIKSSSVTLKAKRDRPKVKVGAKVGGAGSLLSFDGDDALSNGAVVVKTKKKSGFGIDKGSVSRPGFNRDKALGSSALLSNVQPPSGEYTKEKLAELQRNTIRLGVPMPAANNKPAEPVVVLKGLVKPPGATNGNLAETIDAKDDSKGDGGGGVNSGIGMGERDDRDPRKRVDDAESRLGLMGIGSNAESTGITHIPDAAAIAAAKAMRERLRQAQAAPDYISLATGDGAELRSKLREPALVRDQDDVIQREEDESSGDEGEVQGRLAFLGDKPTSQKGRAGIFEAVDERVTELRAVEEQKDDDEEDEERRWEEEQLRKGFGKRVDEPISRVAATSTGPPQPLPTAFNTSLHQVLPSAGGGWGFGRNLEKVSVQQQADTAMRALQEGLQRLRDSHARTEADLYRTGESLSLSLESVSTLEKTMTSAEEKYLYMQELREHVSVLCDFLKDKAPIIEMLGEHLQGLHEQRANAVTERRHGDDLDQQAEVDAAVGAAKEVFGRGGGTASAATAASAAVSASSAQGASSLAPQLDEFGRDVHLQQRMESKRRAQARARRAAQLSSRQKASITSSNGGVGNQRVEAESSSEESESEATGYKSQREKVLDTAGQTFGDASEEFAQLHKVKERLENWKVRFPAAYRDAYVSLSAPAIFAPYVRLELLKWDPLYSGGSFTNMNWYKELSEYGMPQNSKALDANDADNDLVPSLVEKVAIPILYHEIENCWDILSVQGTRRVVSAVEDVVAHVPASSEALLGLSSAIRTKLEDTVLTLDLPAWSYQIIAAVPQAARMSARKFGRSLRLLRNIGIWRTVLATSFLEKLALDDILSAKIIPHLRTLLTTLHDAVTRTERVIAALTGVWLGSSPEPRPKLAPLVEFVLALTRAVEKRRDSAASPDDGIGLARRMKRILVLLNEYDRAHQLFKHFQLKEAL